VIVILVIVALVALLPIHSWIAIHALLEGYW
jgi:hypothetical protein